jgi:hypothetical protein
MLSRLGEEIDWPATPDLARSVMARIDAEAPAEDHGAQRPPAEPRGPRRPFARRSAFPIARRSLALALAALLLLAGAAFAALPGVRHAVLDFFGLRGATVERRATLPPAPPPRPLDLGTRSTLADARGQLGFAPLVPADPGAPDGAYVRRSPPGGELSLTYRPRAGLPRARSTDLGLLVTEFRGDLSPEYAGKIAGQATTVERLRVDGAPAIWVAGAPHFFFYRTPDGRFVDKSLRIAQNALLLQRGRLLIRLEGAMDRDRAVAIARSLR